MYMNIVLIHIYSKHGYSSLAFYIYTSIYNHSCIWKFGGASSQHCQLR